jgi:hypothetical protein
LKSTVAVDAGLQETRMLRPWGGELRLSNYHVHVLLPFLASDITSTTTSDSLLLSRTSAPVDPTAPTFHPVTDKFKQGQLFGELEAKDNEWLAQTSGFVTETQIFYHFLDDGSVLMCQVVHASTG